MEQAPFIVRPLAPALGVEIGGVDLARLGDEPFDFILRAWHAHSVLVFRGQQLGDLLLWDNRNTMHRRDSFDPAARRVMHRTQIRGSAVPRAYSVAAA